MVSTVDFLAGSYGGCGCESRSRRSAVSVGIFVWVVPLFVVWFLGSWMFLGIFGGVQFFFQGFLFWCFFLSCLLFVGGSLCLVYFFSGSQWGINTNHNDDGIQWDTKH